MNYPFLFNKFHPLKVFCSTIAMCMCVLFLSFGCNKSDTAEETEIILDKDIIYDTEDEALQTSKEKIKDDDQVIRERTEDPWKAESGEVVAEKQKKPVSESPLTAVETPIPSQKMVTEEVDQNIAFIPEETESKEKEQEVIGVKTTEETVDEVAPDSEKEQIEDDTEDIEISEEKIQTQITEPTQTQVASRSFEQEAGMVSARDFYGKGMELFNDGEYQGAIRYFKKAVDLDTTFVDAIEMLASSYRNSGLLDDAIIFYKKTVQLKPERTGTYLSLGSLYIKKGDINNAITSYEKYLSKKPENVKVYYNLGGLYRKKGQTDKAIEAYKQALEIDTDYTDVYFNLGALYNKEERYDEAVEVYRELLTMKPKNQDVLYNLSFAFYKKGLYGEAVDTCEKLLEINPGYANAYLLLGYTYDNLGKPEEAKKAFRKYKESLF